MDQISNTFEAIPLNMTIGKVIERKPPSPALTKNVQESVFSRSRGFPAVKRRDCTLSDQSRGSIFSQQQTKKTRLEESTNILEDSNSITHSNDFPSRSYIISSELKDEIHQENINLLKGMSQEEIVEERNKLINTLDPAIVTFLKAKRHQPHPGSEPPVSIIAEKNKVANEISIDEIPTTNDIVTHPDSERWLHFDVVEMNKLAWMKSINIPALKQSYEARFDFGGWLLPFVFKDITEENRDLYHHGEETGRPGYTLQELFQLSRSNVIQQKIIALNTIANVLSLQQTGVYDDVIEIPLEQVFFVVRFSLDENLPPLLNAAIKAMRNLIYFQIDEVCLDNLLGFGLGTIQPILTVDKEGKEDDKTLNDQQLIEKDLVKCFIRTDMLQRIRYILFNVQPPMETVVYCLEILIRLARDSNFIVNQLWNYKELMDKIVECFLPNIFLTGKTDPYGMPIVQAVKLLRILICRSKDLAQNISSRYKLTERFAHYMNNDQLSLNANGLKLQMECLNTWAILLRYQIDVNVSQVDQILLRLLHFHVHNTNLTSSYTRQGHAAAVFNLLAQRAPFTNVELMLSDVLEMAAKKWIVQIGLVDSVDCGRLQLPSSFFNCLAQLHKYKRISINMMGSLLLSMITSSGFKVITSNIRCGSNLLNNFQVHESGANLMTCGAAVWNASNHLIPILHSNGCLPFLTSLSSLLVVLEQKQVTIAFLQHPNIDLEYLGALVQNEFHLVSNWFTHIECTLIMNVLIMSQNLHRQVENSLIFQLAIKSLSVFHIGQKEEIRQVLENIIFNINFYPCELSVSDLALNENENGTNAQLRRFSNVYSNALGLNEVKTNSKLSRDCSAGPFIPADWMYSPLVTFYSNFLEQRPSIRNEQEVIVNCLRWICFYQVNLASLMTNLIMNRTEQYCRICCTFLGSDQLFLEPEVNLLLQQLLVEFCKVQDGSVNFDKDIVGVNNFQDFYTQLLEQYQAVSYGDATFGHFILLPLMQIHNVKFRKTLWSEYAGVVQVFNISEEQLIWPMDSFLYPVEKDISLLKCYQKIIRMGNIKKSSVLYRIATHHLQQYNSHLNNRN